MPKRLVRPARRAGGSPTRSALGRLPCLAVIAGAVAPVGCGAGVSPEETGRVDVTILDDPATTVSRADLRGPRLAHHKNFGADYFHGTVSGSVRIELSEDGARWVGAAATPAASIALQDEEAATGLDPLTVPSGTYRWVRVRLENGSARLDPGGEIGGSELDRAASLSLGGGSVLAELELAVPIGVSPTGRPLLRFDLNAERWVSEDHLLAAEVPAEAIADAISVGVGVDPGAPTGT